MEKNKAVYAKSIKPKNGMPSTTVVVEKAKERPERPALRSLVERIAGSQQFTRNWYYPQGWNFFPNHPDSRCVDFYFPYAEGGALLIDVLEMGEDPKTYEKKKQLLKEHGHRYLLLLEHMNENEALAELEAGK